MVLSFEDILNTVSDDKLMVDYPSLSRDLRQKMGENYISPDLRKAYYAKYINPALGMVEEHNKKERVANCLAKAKEYFGKRDVSVQKVQKADNIMEKIVCFKKIRGNGGK